MINTPYNQLWCKETNKTFDTVVITSCSQHLGVMIIPKQKECFLMPKIFLTSQHDYVFNLDDAEFNNLCLEVKNKKCTKTFGSYDFEKLARHYGRIPICPQCGNGEP